MGEVYTANVIAWLGKESEDSDLAFEAIDALPKSDQVHWDPGVASSVSPEMRSIKHLTALQRLLQRSWWQCVWTVQEGILGRTCALSAGAARVLQSHCSRCVRAFLITSTAAVSAS
jgi:hypothetical protein